MVELGVQRHAHLAAAGEARRRCRRRCGRAGAVRRRRLGELLDLFAQRGDVLARLAQRVGQLLVLGDRLGQLALRLEQPLLERAHALRRVLQPAPQRRRPLPRGASPARGARRARRSYAREPSLVLGLVHEGPPPSRATCPGRYLRRHDATRTCIPLLDTVPACRVHRVVSPAFAVINCRAPYAGIDRGDRRPGRLERRP